MNHALFLLWLAGVEPALLTEVPSVARLVARGADLQLIPRPLAEKSVCYYQVMTGMGSGKFGRYDAVRPVDYSAVADMSVPDGAFGRLLPDILHSRKLTATFVDVGDTVALEQLADQPYDCALVRLSLDHADVERIDELVRRCEHLAGPGATLAVLTDVWSPQPAALVNVNDFLADIGLIETGSVRSRASVNWPESLAYGLGTGQVWVNLRGRETQGVVSSGAEYEEVRDALISELSANWHDPRTGSPVVERVMKKEEAYSGDYLFNAPDLTVVYRPGYAPSPRAAELEFDGQDIMRVTDGDPGAQGMPGPFARLIVAGPALASGFSGQASLVDVVPTVLYLLKQPVPNFVDGQVITAMCTQEFTRQNPVRYYDDEETSEEEEGVIVDRLRDLGYLG